MQASPQEITGIVSQVIPPERHDRHAIPADIYDGLRDDEDLITVRTADPHPTARKILQSRPALPIGMVLWLAVVFIPPARRRVRHVTGDVEYVTSPTGELTEGDNVQLHAEPRVYRVTDGDRVVDLYSTGRIESVPGIKIGRPPEPEWYRDLLDRWDGPSDEQRERQEKYREKLEDDARGEDR